MIKIVSIETAKLLKENGFRQDSEITWVNRCERNTGGYSMMGREESITSWENVDWHTTSHRDELYQKEYFSAPTTDELLEELPEIITLKVKGFGSSVLETKCVLVMGKVIGKWKISYRNQIAHVREENESLPESLAQMWLHLKKENLLCP